jgi:hypothetical protein
VAGDHRRTNSCVRVFSLSSNINTRFCGRRKLAGLSESRNLPHGSPRPSTLKSADSIASRFLLMSPLRTPYGPRPARIDQKVRHPEESAKSRLRIAILTSSLRASRSTI